MVNYHLSCKIGSYYFLNLLLDHELIHVVLKLVLLHVLKVLVDVRLMLEAELVVLLLLLLHYWHG